MNLGGSFRTALAGNYQDYESTSPAIEQKSVFLNKNGSPQYVRMKQRKEIISALSISYLWFNRHILIGFV